MEVSLVFDVGKTNKKILLFDHDQNLVSEKIEVFEEISDEDGFPCDDIVKIKNWVLHHFQDVKTNQLYDLKNVSFSTYGASFVHLDQNGEIVCPLYNYLKPFPENLKNDFLQKYGTAESLSLATASPFMDLLNSGLQLYYIKYAKPDFYQKIKTSLHLPQYLSYLISDQLYSDYTSIGCHTLLWDFVKNDYHSWVFSEGFDQKLAPIWNQKEFFIIKNDCKIGLGLHDTSAAVIPFLKNVKEQFLIISTGTWCIVLNPFDKTDLTEQKLKSDCLNFMKYNGSTIRLSRLFLGKEHDFQELRISSHFESEPETYKKINYSMNEINLYISNLSFENELITKYIQLSHTENNWNISVFNSYKEAYFFLMYGLVKLLFNSIKLVDNITCNKIYIDGGFAKNQLFVLLLNKMLPQKEFIVSDVSQASSIGANLLIQNSSVLN